MISNYSVNKILVHGEPEAYLFIIGDDKFCRQLHMADILKDLQGYGRQLEGHVSLFQNTV